MREILFKAKRLDNGVWVEGSYVYANDHLNAGKAYILPGISDFSYGDNGNRVRIGCFIEVDPPTVCQYTGLTDKHGAKIFEGDIVQTTKYGLNDGGVHNFFGADTFTVVFADGGYCLHNKWRLFNLRPDVDIEICGSIHDREAGK